MPGITLFTQITLSFLFEKKYKYLSLTGSYLSLEQRADLRKTSCDCSPERDDVYIYYVYSFIIRVRACVRACVIGNLR